MKRPSRRGWAVCTPGLEGLLLAELQALGCKPLQAGNGGVAFGATTRQLYAANLWLRTANRVVLRLPTFTAHEFRDLQAEGRDVPWHEFLAPGFVPAFRATSSKSRLYHTDAIVERLEQSVADTVGWPSDPTGEQLFVVRVQNDVFQISVDASGAPLHKRGYRLDVAKAPLRETLAAAMVLASGYDGSAPLLDPFCGSGTIAIEAAMVARSLAPGAGREFAFGSWPSFEAGAWASVLGEAAEREQLDRPLPPIVASDRDAGAVDACRANAERAGVADAVEVVRRAVSDLTAPDWSGGGTPGGASGSVPGWLVTNPPYGVRVGGRPATSGAKDDDLRDLYARLGDVCRTELSGWRIGVLAAESKLLAQAKLPLVREPAFSTDNGGIPVRFSLTALGA